jgi:hypothetical protein
MSDEIVALLTDGPRVVNLGLVDFAESLATQEVPVVHVEWTPPPKLDDELTRLLEELE